MAPIRASVYPVPAEGLSDFKDLALPLEVQIQKHDETADVAYVFVPNEGAFSALENLPGYQVARVDSPATEEETADTPTDGGDAAGSAARETQNSFASSSRTSRKKPLPSNDVFYLITDINMVVPSICLLLLLYLVASLCCCIWSPPLITAALPLGALLLLNALSKTDATHKTRRY